MSAPVVFISYSHDSLAHKDRILALSNKLRQDGVDCRIDQYEESPTDGWPLWCEKQIEQSAFVLVACTQTYLRRFRKEEARPVGLGVTWEGHIISQELYNGQGQNPKFIPIVFDVDDSSFIPLPLKGSTHYKLDEEYDGLYRRLTDQPWIAKPALGTIKTRPQREVLRPQPALERRDDFEPSEHTASKEQSPDILGDEIGNRSSI